MLLKLPTKSLNQCWNTNCSTLFDMRQGIGYSRSIRCAGIDQIDRYLLVLHIQDQRRSGIDCQRGTNNDEYIGLLDYSACYVEHRHIFAKEYNMWAKQCSIFATLIKSLLPTIVYVVYEFGISLGTQLHKFAVKVHDAC